MLSKIHRDDQIFLVVTIPKEDFSVAFEVLNLDSCLGGCEFDDSWQIYFPSSSEKMINDFKLRYSKINFAFNSRRKKIIFIRPRLEIEVFDNFPKKGWLYSRRVKILRGSAFGTGEHPTTNRMLHLMGRLVRSSDRIIDFGAGTGILGLAAEKLGSKEVYFVENDKLAVANLRLNLLLNNSRGRILPLIDCPNTDVIVANVYFSTFINNVSFLLAKRPRLILLSGLRSEDELGILNSWVQIKSVFLDQGWVSCVLTPKIIS
ncbi:MAG: 50S ribosomal protein L11 methyltransferase [Deltaproteobacteria bacterium]|nr:50S ribosomal protein L11 methyltransferase [Deltaproteobacteria bacterium]